MMRRPTEPLLPPDLQDSIRSGKCVAFIGSGASVDCYGTWHELVNTLCERCDSKCRVFPDSSAGEHQDAAEDAKTRDIEQYHAFLGEHFGRPITITLPIYRALLSCKFKSYLTINFDPLLDYEARCTSPQCRNKIMVYPHLDREHIRNRTIYYLHGLIQEHSVPTNGSIVLAHSEFKEAYAKESPLRTFLIPTLLGDPICYIGCRLRELQEVFSVVKEHREKRIRWIQQIPDRVIKPPTSYILLPYPIVSREGDAPKLDEHIMASEDSQYDEYGIKTCRYYIRNKNDHSALKEEFERLAHIPKDSIDYGWEGGNQQYGS